jgi:hypothetical protein
MDRVFILLLRDLHRMTGGAESIRTGGVNRVVEEQHGKDARNENQGKDCNRD